MNLIKVSIERPIAVVSAVIMVVLFGWLALRTIPIQLTPDVNRPVISISTNWPGAAPAEIEREITNRQEEVLAGLTGIVGIDSTSQRNQARVTLEFNIGTNMDRALLLVANRLDRVTGYPEEADEPRLSLSGADDRPIAWFILTRLPGNDRPIHEYGDFVEDILLERLERVRGISETSKFGGSTRELRIVVSAETLARYQLTVNDVVTALRRANTSVSAGDVDEGKRNYIVRAEGELNTVEAVREIVLRTDGDRSQNQSVSRITVGDVARVAFAFTDAPAYIRQLGEPAIAFNARRETGANVIETMRDLRAAMEELKQGPIAAENLTVRQVYDETLYISSAVDLVTQNIWVGGSLAALILLLFLRSLRATVIISIAIPVSVVGSFVAMAVLGRSLNVISLAGLAFAVGMVVDAAIVVLENIFRLREKGAAAPQAAYNGAVQVWGAVFVSALTTVMVFIPILVLDLEVGQLFRDIAVAISVAVMLSLLVSVTVLPALANGLLGMGGRGKPVKRLPLPGIDHFARGFVYLFTGYARLVNYSKLVSVMIVAGITVAMSIGAYKLLPKLEYLPNGNRNLIFASLVPPPGYNLETMNTIAKRFEDATRPYWRTTPEDQRAKDIPVMDRIFFVASPRFTFVGAATVDPKEAQQLVGPLNQLIGKDPDVLGFARQLSLFGRSAGSTRQIDLDISGPDLQTVFDVAARAAGLVDQALPRTQGNGMRPQPALSLGAPEVRVLPNRRALSDAGVTAVELGQSIDAFNDGLRVAEVTIGNSRVDLRLQGPENAVVQTQGIGDLPVVTPQGVIVPVSSLAHIELTAGPTQILHKERFRTVTLLIQPRDAIPFETALDIVRDQVIAPLRDQGLPTGVDLRLSGTADKLEQTWSAMKGQLIISIIIVYLVMAVLFESFVYPLVILLSVPLAAAGGIGGLTVLNMFVVQRLDMLTLLGFIILIGIVVNNAILLVHQTLHHIRHENMQPGDAIIEATRNRIRPIFMSTLTSVFGMMPLVLLPGAGSELYRGLGSVVIGGLSLSALLTLIVIPPMLSITVPWLETWRLKRRAKREELGETAPAE